MVIILPFEELFSEDYFVVALIFQLMSLSGIMSQDHSLMTLAITHWSCLKSLVETLHRLISELLLLDQHASVLRRTGRSSSHAKEDRFLLLNLLASAIHKGLVDLL
jgi:hypothetical protein